MQEKPWISSLKKKQNTKINVNVSLWNGPKGLHVHLFVSSVLQ